MSYVIVSHDSCPDGWGSYFWLLRSLEIDYAQNASTIPPVLHLGGRYGEDPDLEAMTGKTVFLLDFCYPAEQLDAIAGVAKKLIVLDHHETAVGYVDASSLPRYDSVDDAIDSDPKDNFAIIDQDHSGVGIVGEYCAEFGGEPLPPWLEMIQDRDLWKFEFGDLTREVFAAVTSRPYTLEAWGEMHRMGLEALRDEGRAINRYRDQLIDQVAASSFLIALKGDEGMLLIPTASSPYAIGSDVAGRLAEESPTGIGAYVILHASHVQVGLRSRKNGPNVATVAQRYEGGGHPGASGLKLLWSEFREACQ